MGNKIQGQTNDAPAAVLQAYGQLSPHLDTLVDYFKSLISNTLQEAKPIAVIQRKKLPASIYQKLQTGKYQSILEIDDLIGFTIVLRTRSELDSACKQIESSEIQSYNSQGRANVEPSDFKYREPKISAKPAKNYLDRHPELADISVEIQFTTALQHALDAATHDFDYKGTDYEWAKFRVVAQLRATLELADTMIDDMQKGSSPINGIVSNSSGYHTEKELLTVIKKHFQTENLPADLRRLIDIVSGWLKAICRNHEEFDQMLEIYLFSKKDRHSVSVADQILDCLSENNLDELLEHYPRLFCVSSEALEFLPRLNQIPESRRVEL
ncbi:hypothetical protein [Rhodococcus sp. NPDC056516]|uniref:hypothetical protein n=1 Tax=Rhodococcus sp. NPDC056516 TaxID=3345847 RepID=UPI00366ABF41